MGSETYHAGTNSIQMSQRSRRQSQLSSAQNRVDLMAYLKCVECAPGIFKFILAFLDDMSRCVHMYSTEHCPLEFANWFGTVPWGPKRKDGYLTIVENWRIRCVWLETGPSPEILTSLICVHPSNVHPYEHAKSPDSASYLSALFFSICPV